MKFLVNILNIEFKLTDKRFTANQSKLMTFHMRQRQVPTGVNEVRIDESVLGQLTTMKFLGVNFDEFSTWKTYFTSNSKKTLHVSSVN